MQTNHAPAAQPLYSPTQKHIKTPLFVSPQTTPPPDAGSGKTTPPPYPQVPLKDLKTANRLWVQPNPAKEQVTISIPPFIAEKQTLLHLYNTQGKLTEQIPVAPGEFALTLPTQHLPNGVYFLSLMADGIRVANAKLVIQH
ncbi:hypothetical protein BVG80_03080 [Sphingobacteriales bacterium TSM_CSM]|nr:hypothetical protein BVG80_03080 [Sphingobacteriales bacterium TSM_CSM]